MLAQMPTKAEIRNALFDINPNRTPGSNGFGASFFQNYWDLIGKELVDCIKDFFQHGKILKEPNHTFSILIPKMKQP